MKTALQKSIPWQASAFNAAAIIGPPDPLYMEHRWGHRRRCRARVCVSAGGGISGSGRLRDVSMSGAFIETALALPLFSQLAVAMLDDHGARQAAEFIATVVRRENGGVGVEWAETASMPVCRMLGCTESCAFARVV